MKSKSYVFDKSSKLEVMGALELHQAPIHAIGFSPDGGFLASGDD
jgi:hypothetical protein